MKVKVTPGYQVIGKDGKVHTSGTVEMDDVEARKSIAAGSAVKAPTSKSKKAPPAKNKKQTKSDNK